MPPKEFVFIFITIGLCLASGAAIKKDDKTKPMHDEKFIQSRLAEVRAMLNSLGNKMLRTTPYAPTESPVQKKDAEFPELSDSDLDAIIDQLAPKEMQMLKDLDIAIKEEQAAEMLQKMLENAGGDFKEQIIALEKEEATTPVITTAKAPELEVQSRETAEYMSLHRRKENENIEKLEKMLYEALTTDSKESSKSRREDAEEDQLKALRA